VSAHGCLEARFALRDGATELTHLAAQPPLQALRAIRRGTAAEVIVTTLGPGLLGGDAHRLSVEVGPGAHAVVTSQSANRVLPGRSRVSVDLAVGEGALLVWRPLPTILQAGAAYRQDVAVHLAEGARALLIDVLVPGRLAMGERFAFAELDARLAVHGPDGELLVAERQWLRPDRDPLGDAPVLGSLFALGAASSHGTELPNGAGRFTRVLARTADEALRALRTAMPEALWADGPVRPATTRT
jgi:urease accessory protein